MSTETFETAAAEHELAQIARANASTRTPVVFVAGRGHALTIDHGWREVAETALAFARRFT
jgi:hypothetical protein